MITLNQIVYARALIAHGNFRRAAAALGLSQPALSRSIKKLEESLGVTLFDRRPGEVTPTAYGEILLSRAETILNETEEMQRDITILQGFDAGHLSVSMGGYAAELSGYRAIGELIRQHPNLRCQVNINDWRLIRRQVHEKRVDLGMAEIRAMENSDGNLAIEPLARYELLFFCRQGHPLSGRRKVSKADLDAYPLASIVIPPRLAKLFPGKADLSAGTGNLIPSLEVDNLVSARRIVETSDAIGVTTLLQIEPWLKRGILEVLPYRRPWLRLDYGFIYLRHRMLSPSTELFMQLVRNTETGLASRNRELMKNLDQYYS